jgi:FkbM family methyltransferase
VSCPGSRIRSGDGDPLTCCIKLRRVHTPSLKNIRGVAIELRAGHRTLADWRSKARWTADIFLQRAPRALRGPRRDASRSIRLASGIQIRYRLNRGDLQSIREVWLNQAYRVPADLGAVKTIVDLGANIGLTSLYLAATHQPRRLVAVEPDSANAELVRQNLALNGIHGSVLEAAVAATDGVAYFQDDTRSNVGHLAATGRAVRAVSMDTVLAELGTDVVDILKMDIEGGEEDVLSGDLAWLTNVRCLVVEFHPGLVDSGRLARLLEAHGFTYIPAGSVHVQSTSAFIRGV